MGTHPWGCITAVHILPNNQLMFMGEYTGKHFGTETNPIHIKLIIPINPVSLCLQNPL